MSIRASLLPVLFLCTSYLVSAQEMIYLADGSQQPYRLVEASDGQLKYGEPKGNRIVKRPFQRTDFLFAFNAQGKYLLPDEISTDPEQAQKQFNEFYVASGSTYDLLIKANPAKLIQGTISYNSNEVINYKTPQGVPGSFKKADLIAVIYRNGQHELMASAAEVAPVLVALKPQLQQQRAKTPAPNPSPQAGWNPVPVNPETPTATSKVASQPTTSGKPGLSDDELLSYRDKGIRRVEEFVQYLNIISDKSISPDEKDKAIDQALTLFLPGATIEVNSVNRPGVRQLKIKDYLTRLKLLPYTSVRIEWNEVNYVKELTQAADGNYYGVISGQQKFVGYGSDGQHVKYQDVTQKNAKVMLQSYQKLVEGQEQVNWAVLLGNIGVAVN
ncbi:hypothetical protein [Spirosoma panaciterrae]|uniref:hypothetical protein n=1 Tax=Spirosoma panaciterrae TaxID=496058 RepID=UPI0007C4FF8E|nr:hypothetical protein [Spirosoma panaciterrae]